MANLNARESIGIRKTRGNDVVDFRESQPFNHVLKENLCVRTMISFAGFVHSNLSLRGRIEDGNVCPLTELCRCSSQRVTVGMSRSVWFDLGATTVEDYDDGMIAVLPVLE